MSIFRKIDLILAKFGNVKAMKRTHIDTFTEEKIKNVTGDKYGISEFGLLYVVFQELAGFYFINTTVISATDFKTNKGAILEFISEQNKFVCKSDDYIVESDFSNVSNRWITKISYPVSENEFELIQKKDFTSVIFKVKKYKIQFNINF